MTKVSDELSRRMANMGFVCAILVVMIHADVAATGFQGQIMQIVRGITRIAVPWFFLAAGFFLAGHMDEKGWWKREVSKRVKTLLIPFFCWLFIYRLYDLILNVIARCVGYDFGGGAYLGLCSEIMYLLGVHPFRLAGVIWFLRALFFLAVLSPILCSPSRVKTGVLLSVLFVLYAGHEMRMDAGNTWLFFEYFLPLRGMFYFATGIALRRFDFNLIGSATSFLRAFGIWMLLLCLKCYYPKILIVNAVLLDVLMIPFVMYAIFGLAGRMFIPESVARQSLAIYLLHMPVLVAMAGVCSLCHAKTFFSTSLMAFTIKVLFVVPFALFAACYIRNHVCLSTCLFGGRITTRRNGR